MAFVVISELKSSITEDSALCCYWAIGLVSRVGRTRLLPSDYYYILLRN